MHQRSSAYGRHGEAAVETDPTQCVRIRRFERFATTHWTVVRTAAKAGSTAAAVALDQLCRDYWRPVFAHLLREGIPTEQAKDLAQEYFQRLIANNLPAQADPLRGKFRSFVLLTLKHFLSDEFRRARRSRCIPSDRLLPLEAADLQPQAGQTESGAAAVVEAIFDRDWAQALVDQTRRLLEAECATSGKQAFFAAVQDFLPGGQEQGSYAELAKSTGLNVNAVKVRVHRLRERFGELLRAAIAETVDTPAEVDEEVRYLIQVLTQTASSFACGASCGNTMAHNSDPGVRPDLSSSPDREGFPDT